MRRARGRVVHIGSASGYEAVPFAGPYAASKFALEGLTDALRRELRPWGLEVAIVEPGSIETPIWDKAWSYNDQARENLSPRALELYGSFIDRMFEFIRQVAKQAILPETVARAVHHALTASRPRTRYRVGTDAKIGRLMAHVLPDRVLDALMTWTARLPRKGSL